MGGGDMVEKAEEMETMDDMEEEENDENLLPSNVEVFAKKSKKPAEPESKLKEKVAPLYQIKGNLKFEKLRKLEAKKAKKDARRRDRVAETLSNQMDDAFSQLTT